LYDIPEPQDTNRCVSSAKKKSLPADLFIFHKCYISNTNKTSGSVFIYHIIYLLPGAPGPGNSPELSIS
jgi:hypothetical protein